LEIDASALRRRREGRFLGQAGWASLAVAGVSVTAVAVAEGEAEAETIDMKTPMVKSFAAELLLGLIQNLMGIKFHKRLKKSAVLENSLGCISDMRKWTFLMNVRSRICLFPLNAEVPLPAGIGRKQTDDYTNRRTGFDDKAEFGPHDPLAREQSLVRNVIGLRIPMALVESNLLWTHSSQPSQSRTHDLRCVRTGPTQWHRKRPAVLWVWPERTGADEAQQLSSRAVLFAQLLRDSAGKLGDCLGQFMQLVDCNV
jgi:hypothetical protein